MEKIYNYNKKIEERKILYYLLSVLIILSVIILISAALPNLPVYHTDDKITVRVNNKDISLKDAIATKELFSRAVSSGSPSNLFDPGHSSDGIIVSIDDQEYGLSTAISNRKLFVKPTKQSSPKSPSSGHSSSEIWITSLDKTLQQAIDDGEFATCLGDTKNPGEVFTEEQACTYSCNCGKGGCQTCTGKQTRQAICNKGVVEPYQGSQFSSCS